MFKKIGYTILIFIFIQAMNQCLIFSGSALEKIHLFGNPGSRALVGVFQQLIQALIGLGLYRLLFKNNAADLGINTINKKVSIKSFCIFALIWSLTILLYVFAIYNFSPNVWLSMKSIELPQTKTIIETLLFESFFPGLGEEILFRGFIINLLIRLVFTDYQDNGFQKIGVIALSSTYFATAHIYFTLEPFRLTHIDYLQIVMALGCGGFYAFVYLKTKSLITPFLAHNFANTTSTICGYMISCL